MSRALVLLWVGVVVPFALTFVNGGPDGRLPHVLFHPAYMAFLAVGLIGVRLLRRASEVRALRRLATTIGIAMLLAMAGHTGEFLAVLLAGGMHADETVFEAPLHLISASVTVPAILVAILLVIAATITARIVARGKPLGAALNRGIRTAHRWTSLGFAGSIPLLLLFEDNATITAIPIAALVVMLLTGLQMSIRHYLTRWRRSRSRAQAHGSAPELPTEATRSAQLSSTS